MRNRKARESASPTFFAHAVNVNREAQGQLLELLQLDEDRGRQAICDVGTYLGIYVNDSQHIDDIPRPSDYIKVFKPIQQSALKLLNSIYNLGGYYLEQIQETNVDAIKQSLLNFIEASEQVVNKMKGEPTTGAGTEAAFYHTVTALREIFRSYYSGSLTGRNQNGAFQSLSSEEKSELAFVKCALLDARIKSKQFLSNENLLRVFRQHCTVSDEWPNAKPVNSTESKKGAKNRPL